MQPAEAVLCEDRESDWHAQAGKEIPWQKLGRDRPIPGGAQHATVGLMDVRWKNEAASAAIAQQLVSADQKLGNCPGLEWGVADDGIHFAGKHCLQEIARDHTAPRILPCYVGQERVKLYANDFHGVRQRHEESPITACWFNDQIGRASCRGTV